MSRSSPSPIVPLLFACASLIFAAGAGYAWWTERRAPPTPTPVLARADAPAAPQPARGAASAPPAARPAPVLRKCMGGDGVPVFTSAACPAGSTLEREIAVEVPAQQALPPATPPVAAPSAVAVANANASVIVSAPAYGIADRRDRLAVERERAWDRCERGKVRADAELAALRNKRTMSQIRKWEAYAMRECAPYAVMSR